MTQPPRIYLDNAATSWPKPEEVYRAMDRFQRELGAPAGRSAYAEAAEVEQQVRKTRSEIADLIGAKDARQVIFTCNGTDALNLAIHGLLRPGDHVITTVAEHNSVLRPLRAMEDAGQIEVSRVGCNAEGVVDPGDVSAELRSSTRLIALVHASNVTGALQPAQQIGRLARQHGAFFLLDAAQTLGDVPVDVEDLQADLLAAPGHKGLLGPLGTGVLFIRAGVEEHLASIRQGGTGSRSELDRQPDFLPDKYESGNLNALGILGLGAGVAYLKQRGIETVRQHALDLTDRLMTGLWGIDQVTVHGPRDPARRVGLVSISFAGFEPQEVAGMLDSSYRIQARAGLHCAPAMHRSLGTLAAGGAVRFSVGPFNTESQIDIAVQAVREIAAASASM